MKAKYLLLLIAIFVHVSANSQSERQTEELTTEQQELISKALKNYPEHSQLSIALVQEQQVAFYGVIRTSDSLQMVENRDSIFEIGSVSKVFTSVLLANFALDGKLKTTDAVNDYLDFSLNDSIRITFEQLSNHTAGLPRMPADFRMMMIFNPNNPYQKYDEEKLVNHMRDDLLLSYAQDSASHYSNLGTAMLGYTLCHIAGRDYNSLLDSLVFNKYAMHSSTCKRSDVEERLVSGRTKEGGIATNWDMNSMTAAGGILSSTSDLSKFAMAQFDPANKELALCRQTTFVDTAALNLGLGWHIIVRDSSEWHWHNGGTGGYSSSFALDAEKKTAVIILSNVSAFHPENRQLDRLCFRLLKTLE